MTIFINPGSGPVAGATFEQARLNIEQFCDDLREGGQDVPGYFHETDPPSNDGRFTFTVEVDGCEHKIDMPGIPLDEVRWMDEPEQNIWDFPRLYVDDSSWVWKFALGVCTPPDPDDEW